MISEHEYIQRRKAFLEKLKPNSLVVVMSAKAQTRSNDTEYPYRQNSNFYYLTGFREDNAILVLRKAKKSVETYLFVQKKEKLLELWTGKRVGVDAAKKSFSYDDIFSTDCFDAKFDEFVKKSQNFYYDFLRTTTQIDILKRKTKHFHSHNNIAPIIGMLRLIKSKAEIQLIKKALLITQEAHHYAMKQAQMLSREYELQAGVEFIFKKNGAYNDAYTSIVACGNSANTLHYISNNKKLRDGKLILMDAGCEYEYYASDITRSFPVNGKFTPPQRELYEMILDVEKRIINMVKPNILRSKLQEKSVELLCRGLVKLGILKGDVSKLIKKEKYKKYYPHGIGHWMGIDVHDESPYKDKKGKEIPLMAGMIMTIEPGIYIDKDDKNVPKKYRGIGIRIEDDILVTHNGFENLSRGIAKEIEEIEALSLEYKSKSNL